MRVALGMPRRRRSTAAHRRATSSSHIDASVGTVETTVTPRCASHGPSSDPARTIDRGAGTSAAPLRQASQISSQLASNPTDKPASTRSSRSTVHSRASASTNAAAERWLTATPFGAPVDPDVKITQASSSTLSGQSAPRGFASRSDRRARRVRQRRRRSARTRPPPRPGGSSASTGTYAAPD